MNFRLSTNKRLESQYTKDLHFTTVENIRSAILSKVIQKVYVYVSFLSMIKGEECFVFRSNKIPICS